MKPVRTKKIPKPTLARMLWLCAILLAGFIAIYIRLYSMMITNSDAYVNRASTKSTKTITIYGKRGTIYDVNMVPLAYDQTSYNVTFYRDPTKSSDEWRASYTQVLIKTIRLIESNGKQTVNSFWMKKDDDGVWRFNSGSGSESVERTRRNQWVSNFYLSSVDEEDYWEVLCDKYFIPDDLDDDMKVKVLSLWQESRMNAFNSTPVAIAYDVGFETVSEIESMSMDLDGIDIQESSTRVYPQGRTASHITGYISKISSNQLSTYQSQGYPNDAYIGAAGIEYSLEDQLSPYIIYRQGKREVEISTKGKVVRELSYTPPTDGNSVVLTIDIELEKVMKEALVETIETIHDTQEVTIRRAAWREENKDILERYEEHDWEISLAETGAMVAMDPHTGRILGMVSYPDYDLSMFNGGQVNSAMWNEVLENSDNDPLYNRAISTRDTPGSIFKLCTSLAGLSEGAIQPDERITDMGSFTKTNSTNPAKCWINSKKRSEHANQTIVDAIKHSCNYFFYEVSYRLGVNKLYEWAARLGLTTKTNIELPGESTSFVGNQTMLYDPDRDVDDQYTSKPRLVYDSIRELLERTAADRGAVYSEDTLDTITLSLMRIAVSYESKGEWLVPIRECLQYDLGLPKSYISNHFMVNTIVTYLQDIFWTPNETIMDGIGQSITQLTPVCVARYVSAIVNGGTVYDAQIVDRIISADGSLVLEKEPVIANQIDADPYYFELIQEGMRDVTSAEDGGTAGKYFNDCEYKIAAKTGTSQRTELDVENNAWLVAYAPADVGADPKIVVVVYVQNGYAGAQTAPAAIKVISWYLDSLKEKEGTTVASEFSVAD